MPSIIPNLWFDTQARKRPRSPPRPRRFADVGVTRSGEAGPREAGLVLTVELELGGQRFVAVTGGPESRSDEALSLEIRCETQQEIDELWSRLTADRSDEGPCG